MIYTTDENNTLTKFKEDAQGMINLGLSHFLTFTLKPSFVCDKGLKAQNKGALKQLLQHLSIFTDSYTLVLEKHKSGNAHYHAIVNWTTRMNHPMDKLTDCIKYSQILGKHQFDRIDVDNGIVTYMFKDYWKTYDVLNYKRHMNKYQVCHVWERSPNSKGGFAVGIARSSVLSRGPQNLPNMDSDTANTIQEYNMPPIGFNEFTEDEQDIWIHSMSQINLIKLI